MVYIKPFGDPTAHGTIGNVYTFRRYRGSCQLERKPRNKYTSTQAQITQRNKFSDVAVGWTGLKLEFQSVFMPSVPPKPPGYPSFVGKTLRGKTRISSPFFAPSGWMLDGVSDGTQAWYHNYPSFAVFGYSNFDKTWRCKGGRIKNSSFFHPWGSVIANTDQANILFASNSAKQKTFRFKMRLEIDIGWWTQQFTVELKTKGTTEPRLYYIDFSLMALLLFGIGTVFTAKRI